MVKKRNGIIAIGASIAGIFGYAIKKEEQDAISELAVLIATVVGGALAVYGRVRATSGIK